MCCISLRCINQKLAHSVLFQRDFRPIFFPSVLIGICGDSSKILKTGRESILKTEITFQNSLHVNRPSINGNWILSKQGFFYNFSSPFWLKEDFKKSLINMALCLERLLMSCKKYIFLNISFLFDVITGLIAVCIWILIISLNLNKRKPTFQRKPVFLVFVSYNG